MRTWTHYETVAAAQYDETVLSDYGYLDPDGNRWSMDGVHGQAAHYVQAQTAHHFPVESLDDFDAIVAWVLGTAGHVDVRYEDVPDGPGYRTVTATLYVTDAGPVNDDDDDPYVSAVTIEGTRGQVLAVMRLLDRAYSPTDLTEAYGGGYLI